MDTTTDGRSEGSAWTTWQLLAEGGALFAMGAAPMLAVIATIDGLRGGTTTIEVSPIGGQTVTANGQALPIDTAFIEVVPSTGQAWAIGVGRLALALVIAGIAWLVHRTLTEVRTDPGPFRRGITSRLAWLALAILAAWVLHNAVTFLTTTLLTPDGVGATFTFNILPLFVAGFVGVLARILVRGRQMERELEGLV